MPCASCSRSKAASSSPRLQLYIRFTPTTSIVNSFPSPTKSQPSNISFNSTQLPSQPATQTMSSSRPSSYLSTTLSTTPLPPPWCFSHLMVLRTPSFGTPLSNAISPMAISHKLLSFTPKCELPLFYPTDSLSPWLLLRAQS